MKRAEWVIAAEYPNGRTGYVPAMDKSLGTMEEPPPLETAWRFRSRMQAQFVAEIANAVLVSQARSPAEIAKFLRFWRAVEADE